MNTASPLNPAFPNPATPPGSESAMPVGQASPAGEARGVSIVSAALISAAVSCTFVISGLMLYDSLFKVPPRAIATVDIDAIVSAREMALMESLSRPGASDVDREQAYEAVASLGRQIEDAIQEASATCNCDVLVRGAVVGRAKMDLTEQIATSLGITPAAVATGRARIRSALSAAAPTATGPAALQPALREARP